MSRYYVSADGCDDSTPVVLELSDREYSAVRRVVDAVNVTSSKTCMPEMTLRRASAQDEQEAREALAEAKERGAEAGAR